MTFSGFQAVTCISRVNCAEMAGNRSRQPAYEIFSKNMDFSNPSSDPLGSRMSAHVGVKKGYTPQKVVIYPLLACLA